MKNVNSFAILLFFRFGLSSFQCLFFSLLFFVYFLHSQLTMTKLKGLIPTEEVVQRCSVKKVFLEILQNSQGNTCARVSFLIKLEA